MDKLRVQRLIRELIVELGEDPMREGLLKTPERVAKTYDEIYRGYNSNSDLSLKFSEDSNVVIAKDIQFYSMCEHHMLPFFGKITIVYHPDKKVFGISKLIRLVEKYSRRLQIQERLTNDIANELHGHNVRGVIVIINAEHLCMKMRGVKNESKLTTITRRGIYEDDQENITSMIRRSAYDF